MIGNWERKHDNYCRRDIEGKIVNKKPPDQRGVQEKKLMLYDWGLKNQEIWDFETQKIEVFDEGQLEFIYSYRCRAWKLPKFV